MFLFRKSTLGLVAAAAVSAVLGLSSVSCKQEMTTFSQAACGTDHAEWCGPRTFAGGIEADLQTLNDGHDAYMLYCYACHGVKGDGKGPASYGLRPAPRDFTLGIFKFARVRSSDDVPHDDDLMRIVQGGLHGTAMLQWDIPEVELKKIIQYIKTFAPKKWEKKKKSGEPVKTLEPFALDDKETKARDSWTGKEAQAITRGRELYHFKAECATCHPSYGTKDELYKLSLDASKREPDVFKAVGGFRDDPYGSVAKDSDEYKARILPPDFAFSSVRSVRQKHELEDLFRVLAYGVYPIMPAWKGALPPEDIWAIAHYVKSLMDIKDTKAASDMRTKHGAQPAFEIPKPAEPPPAATADGDKPADAADKKDEKAGDKKDEKAGDKKDEKKVDEKKVDKKDEKAPEKK